MFCFFLFVFFSDISGRAYLYDLSYTGNSWTLTAMLTPSGSDLSNSSAFGHGVSIYGSYAAAGAPNGNF